MPLVMGLGGGLMSSVQPCWMGKSDSSHTDLGYLIAAQ